ncbi:MAG: MBL fold metallo-hydrolase [Thermoplasmata archaeon]
MAADPRDLVHPFVRPLRAEAVPLFAPAELATARSGPEPPFLLDVRPAGERRLARLADDRAIPLAELPLRWGELPHDRAIVAYCQFGDQARRAAGFLRSRGFSRAGALEGGIDEFSRRVDPTIPRYGPEGVDLLVLQEFPRPQTGCLAYLLGEPDSRQAVLIDPGLDVAPYLAELARGSWHLAAIVETHTHADHRAGHAALAATTGAPIFLSRRSPAQYPHRVLADGEEIRLGRASLRALETPGHTRDHLTLLIAGKAFTGDTLLMGSCGRTDLGDGDPNLLWESLTDRLLKLPDATEIFPAHYGRRHALPEGFATSLGFERRTNEALTQGSREEFVRYMTEGWPPKPPEFDRIVADNLAG